MQKFLAIPFGVAGIAVGVPAMAHSAGGHQFGMAHAFEPNHLPVFLLLGAVAAVLVLAGRRETILAAKLALGGVLLAVACAHFTDGLLFSLETVLGGAVIASAGWMVVRVAASMVHGGIAPRRANEPED